MTLSESDDGEALLFIEIEEELLACHASRRNHMELFNTTRDSGALIHDVYKYYIIFQFTDDLANCNVDKAASLD